MLCLGSVLTQSCSRGRPGDLPSDWQGSASSRQAHQCHHAGGDCQGQDSSPLGCPASTYSPTSGSRAWLISRHHAQDDLDADQHAPRETQ
ncbi:hypothetical protein LAZ67_1001751 [Cordylochernes scorpioides]|uniref:Arginine vasotocin receptor n=1 Tax=Cordylochernes scorpioides TaxID=51811 RepID=A0ABY6JVN0_9ARAC|nr:hypothetical protein LAZ67_1001751 [Cordylochernes scorpioides]